jgi:hypothetical protein
MTVHTCECPAGEPCVCGRPRGRQASPELMSENGRLGQLQGMYQRGERPTEDDIQFLQTGVRRTQNYGAAGRLLTAWGEQGLVPGYAPSGRGRVA